VTLSEIVPRHIEFLSLPIDLGYWGTARTQGQHQDWDCSANSRANEQAPRRSDIPVVFP